MKVLWLTSSYPRTPDDTASVFLRHLALALQREGIDLHVLTPDDPLIDPASSAIPLHTFRYFFPRHWQKLAYGSGILPNLRRNPLLYLQIPCFLAGMASTLWRLCQELQPDLIHAHWIIPQGSIAVLVGHHLRIPVVVTAHGGDAFALQNPALKALKCWTLRQAIAWTANTQVTAEAIPKVTPPVIIPMGVDYARFAHAVPKRKDSEKVILFVGRLVEKKGVADLIEAYAKLPTPWQRRCRLWIVGDGAERETLQTKVRKLGLADQVHFWGRMPYEALPAFYAAADLFVAPSIRDRSGDTEGQGVVFLEAMASGTAVIATQTGGIGEVIEDGIDGILVRPADAMQLSAAMTRLLEDETYRHLLACRGQEKARAYDWTVIGQRFAELYRNVADGNEGHHIHRSSSKKLKSRHQPLE